MPPLIIIAAHSRLVSPCIVYFASLLSIVLPSLAHVPSFAHPQSWQNLSSPLPRLLCLFYFHSASLSQQQQHQHSSSCFRLCAALSQTTTTTTTLMDFRQLLLLFVQSSTPRQQQQQHSLLRLRIARMPQLIIIAACSSHLSPCIVYFALLSSIFLPMLAPVPSHARLRRISVCHRLVYYVYFILFSFGVIVTITTTTPMFIVLLSPRFRLCAALSQQQQRSSPCFRLCAALSWIFDNYYYYSPSPLSPFSFFKKKKKSISCPSRCSSGCN